eukprot:TRINITY_DN1986_c0_g1_i1.p1 TRINITY_DN1986_c0_g1~~TRINITY_DN1986_c0_g1_i1.p1  ORF type:complete len:2857 (+),score=968.14 TRINITY_DN1986_c0_g1_i1:65-8635(+)
MSTERVTVNPSVKDSNNTRDVSGTIMTPKSLALPRSVQINAHDVVQDSNHSPEKNLVDSLKNEIAQLKEKLMETQRQHLLATTKVESQERMLITFKNREVKIQQMIMMNPTLNYSTGLLSSSGSGSGTFEGEITPKLSGRKSNGGSNHSSMSDVTVSAGPSYSPDDRDTVEALQQYLNEVHHIYEQELMSLSEENKRLNVKYQNLLQQQISTPKKGVALIDQQQQVKSNGSINNRTRTTSSVASLGSGSTTSFSSSPNNSAIFQGNSGSSATLGGTGPNAGNTSNIPSRRVGSTIGKGLKTNNRLESEYWSEIKFLEYLEMNRLGRIAKVFQSNSATPPPASTSSPQNRSSKNQKREKKAALLAQGGGNAVGATSTDDVGSGSSSSSTLLTLPSSSNPVSTYSTPVEMMIFEKSTTRKNVLQLVSATPLLLIDLLTIPEMSPVKAFWEYNKFLYSFLIVFPIFMTPQQFLTSLITKFNSVKETPDNYDYGVRASILMVLREWMRLEQGRDFKDHPDLIKIYQEFVSTQESKDFGIALTQLLNLLKYNNSSVMNSVTISEGPVILSEKPKNILDIHPLELSRQLTLIHANQFIKIKRIEFMKGAWYKQQDKNNALPPTSYHSSSSESSSSSLSSSLQASHHASNLTYMIEYSNRLSSWITTEILKWPTSKSRAQVISFFINVLQNLESMNNFNGIIQVLSSLHSSTIGKLKKSWELVGKKERETFDRITELMSNVSHYKAYREVLSTLHDYQPCIPIISNVCADLFMVDDTVPDFTPHNPNWVNWTKMEVIAELIASVKRFEYGDLTGSGNKNQSSSSNTSSCGYPYLPVPSIQNFIEHSECWLDEDICYEIAALRDKHENPELQYTNTDDLWSFLNTSTSPSTSGNRESDEVTERDWKVILTASQILQYKPSEVILERGKQNQHLFRIKSGAADVIIHKENGKREVVATLKAGQVFGEMSMLLRFQEGKTSADIVAQTHCEVYRIEINLVIQLCASHPKVSAALNLFLARKLAQRLKMNTSKPSTTTTTTTSSTQDPKILQSEALLSSSTSSTSSTSTPSISSGEITEKSSPSLKDGSLYHIATTVTNKKRSRRKSQPGPAKTKRTTKSKSIDDSNLDDPGVFVARSSSLATKNRSSSPKTLYYQKRKSSNAYDEGASDDNHYDNDSIIVGSLLSVPSLKSDDTYSNSRSNSNSNSYRGSLNSDDEYYSDEDHDDDDKRASVSSSDEDVIIRKNSEDTTDLLLQKDETSNNTNTNNKTLTSSNDGVTKRDESSQIKSRPMTHVVRRNTPKLSNVVQSFNKDTDKEETDNTNNNTNNNDEENHRSATPTPLMKFNKSHGASVSQRKLSTGSNPSITPPPAAPKLSSALKSKSTISPNPTNPSSPSKAVSNQERVPALVTPLMVNGDRRSKTSRKDGKAHPPMTPTSAGGVGVEMDLDSKFCKTFGLRDEIVVKEMQCKWKRSGGAKWDARSGTLYLSQNYICFYAVTFGFKMKEVVPFFKIKDIVLNGDNSISVELKDGRSLIFTNFQSGVSSDDNSSDNTRNAYTLLSHVWKTKTIQDKKSEKYLSKERTLDQSSSNNNNNVPQPPPLVVLRNSSPSRQHSNGGSGSSSSNNEKKLLKPKEEDWNMILKGSKLVKFKPGEVVIKEGQQSRQLYQISVGSCRIEKSLKSPSSATTSTATSTENNQQDVISNESIRRRSSSVKSVVVGYLTADDGVFGEISFLENGRATASVIAQVATEVYIIEAYFLNILFQHFPALAGRFYHYLAGVLAKRVITREQQSLQAAAKIALEKGISKSADNNTTTTTKSTQLLSPPNKESPTKDSARKNSTQQQQNVTIRYHHKRRSSLPPKYHPNENDDTKSNTEPPQQQQLSSQQSPQTTQRSPNVLGLKSDLRSNSVGSSVTTKKKKSSNALDEVDDANKDLNKGTATSSTSSTSSPVYNKKVVNETPHEDSTPKKHPSTDNKNNPLIQVSSGSDGEIEASPLPTPTPTLPTLPSPHTPTYNPNTPTKSTRTRFSKITSQTNHTDADNNNNTMSTLWLDHQLESLSKLEDEVLSSRIKSSNGPTNNTNTNNAKPSTTDPDNQKPDETTTTTTKDHTELNKKETDNVQAGALTTPTSTTMMDTMDSTTENDTKNGNATGDVDDQQQTSNDDTVKKVNTTIINLNDVVNDKFSSENNVAVPDSDILPPIPHTDRADIDSKTIKPKKHSNKATSPTRTRPSESSSSSSPSTVTPPKKSSSMKSRARVKSSDLSEKKSSHSKSKSKTDNDSIVIVPESPSSSSTSVPESPSSPTTTPVRSKSEKVKVKSLTKTPDKETGLLSPKSKHNTHNNSTDGSSPESPSDSSKDSTPNSGKSSPKKSPNTTKKSSTSTDEKRLTKMRLRVKSSEYSPLPSSSKRKQKLLSNETNQEPLDSKRELENLILMELNNIKNVTTTATSTASSTSTTKSNTSTSSTSSTKVRHTSNHSSDFTKPKSSHSTSSVNPKIQPADDENNVKKRSRSPSEPPLPSASIKSLNNKSLNDSNSDTENSSKKKRSSTTLSSKSHRSSYNASTSKSSTKQDSGTDGTEEPEKNGPTTRPFSFSHPPLLSSKPSIPDNNQDNEKNDSITSNDNISSNVNTQGTKAENTDKSLTNRLKKLPKSKSSTSTPSLIINSDIKKEHRGSSKTKKPTQSSETISPPMSPKRIKTIGGTSVGSASSNGSSTGKVTKDSKDSKDTKDTKDTKDIKDSKETKDSVTTKQKSALDLSSIPPPTNPDPSTSPITSPKSPKSKSSRKSPIIKRHKSSKPSRSMNFSTLDHPEPIGEDTNTLLHTSSTSPTFSTNIEIKLKDKEKKRKSSSKKTGGSLRRSKSFSSIDLGTTKL